MKRIRYEKRLRARLEPPKPALFEADFKVEALVKMEVFRFENEEVFQNPESVVAEIKKHFNTG